MVRILVYVYVLIQVALLMQIHNLRTAHELYSFLPSMDFLKIGEIITFVPILLILAYRTRQMRGYYMRHIHEDEEADEAAAKKKQ